MFWSKNKKNRYTPAHPSFSIYIKVGFKGVYIARTCFPDEPISSDRARCKYHEYVMHVSYHHDVIFGLNFQRLFFLKVQSK